MNEKQWNDLIAVINGEKLSTIPVGFIIDSPWLPHWFGVNIIDYFSNDDIWFQANLKAITTFPDIMFLPGFWAEFGMCTEPSAFGAKCSFPPNEFPHAHKCISSVNEIDDLQKPNPETDGLAPFVLNRLKLNQASIEKNGHHIRFSISRGPLNVASYLMGSTEFLMAMMTDSPKIHCLMRIITDYLKDWHELQQKLFPSIDGILILDDIIGFLGDEQFREFGLPYFKELFDSRLSVKFLHNDAPCKVSAPYLPEMGVNLFNMGFDVDLNELKMDTDNKVTMLGNIPPRDVLAKGSHEEIRQSAKSLLDSLDNKERVIFSCGGGMPPGVSSENLNVFRKAINELSL